MRLIKLTEAKRHILYHVAPMKKIERIKREGIQPQRKASTSGAFGQDVRKAKGAIYAFDAPVDALQWATRMELGSPGMKDVYAIIQFHSTAAWQPDTHWEASTAQGQWLYSTEGVPPEAFLAVVPVDYKQVDASGWELAYREPGLIQKWVGAPKKAMRESNVPPGFEDFDFPQPTAPVKPRLDPVDSAKVGDIFDVGRKKWIAVRDGTGTFIPWVYLVGSKFQKTYAIHRASLTDYLEVEVWQTNPATGYKIGSGPVAKGQIKKIGHDPKMLESEA